MVRQGADTGSVPRMYRGLGVIPLMIMLCSRRAMP
jgi:hypothetical protein